MNQSQPDIPIRGRSAGDPQPNKSGPCSLEDFIRLTFGKLPARTRVLVSLFSALNSATALTKNFGLPGQVGKIVRSEPCGPLNGESEEVNWLKGVCDGLSLLAEHS